MGLDYTTGGLIDAIKRNASIPVNPSTFTAAKLLAFADDMILTKIVPMVRSIESRHFTEYEDVTTTTATAYDIPEEAMNRGLVDVAMLTTDGNPYSLVLIDLHREIDVDGYWRRYLSGIGARRGYYIQGDQLHLFPDSKSGETIRFYYERIRNRLCLSQDYTATSETQEAAKVVSVNTGNGEVTCVSSTVPTAWDNGTELCVVRGVPGFTLRVASTTASAATGTVVTLPTADVADIVAGDWIAPLGDTPVVPLPVECHPILAQAVAVRCLVAQGDPDAEAAAAVYSSMEQDYKATHTRRVTQGAQRVFSRNRLADYVRH